MACLYRLVVELEHNVVDGELYNWVIAHGLELNDPLSNYITAMMWSIQTMTTVGYGDVVSFFSLIVNLTTPTTTVTQY
jgi:voltage-gated potassium channel Kch